MQLLALDKCIVTILDAFLQISLATRALRLDDAVSVYLQRDKS